MILLITATIKSSERKSAFHDIIKSHSPVWWHYIDKTWLVKTDSSVTQWVDWLRPAIDDKADAIFITPIDGFNFNGWLPEKAYSWIRNNR